ncbi:hypothetical protein E2C01_016086 [Portunus trituberculatus]|uniref:Uncharacterized protein n=1 Tax=Portunus trituberculatus TaxID=210409 RepID=A0A5B7DPN5_PORTR|nr:hypothetical protein [Portunus trituberculatus]
MALLGFTGERYISHRATRILPAKMPDIKVAISCWGGTRTLQPGRIAQLFRGSLMHHASWAQGARHHCCPL